MNRGVRAPLAAVAMLLAVSPAVSALGVGGGSWTPAESTTSSSVSRFLVANDSVAIRTDAVWDEAQSSGLEAYTGQGLRYTLEVNDRDGRLSATGFWATNFPDPAFDRDDDDGDGRWEEAEVIAGAEAPEPGRTYTASIQFSRWHGKRVRGVCQWAWDRRRGEAVVLSQLSRRLLGEWQAQRYTLPYHRVAYPRVGRRPDVPTDAARARCRDQRPGADQDGLVVTFARPLDFSEFGGLVTAGSGKWTAFEAVGGSEGDDRLWTCGGPVEAALRLRPCRALGVLPEGISAGVGYFDALAAEQLRAHPDVVAVDDLRDQLTDLLVGGFGLEPPGLTVDDRYWDLVLAE